jgi:iron complex transport system substrate-binding protein
MRPAVCLVALAIALLPAMTAAELRVVDDGGDSVVLPGPARRIVSLAPHATELLFAAGAGSRIVATVRHSDHPEAARSIPRIGDALRLDMERLLALKPDLVVAWLDGTPERALEPIRRAGVPVYRDRPRKLVDVARSLERLGHLAGTDVTAGAASRTYLARLEGLRHGQANRPDLTVFFQVWRNPLMTLNGDQVIDDALRLCGGRNVFAQERLAVATVDIESVVRRDPDAIIVLASSGESDEALSAWKRLPGLRATSRGNLVPLDDSSLARPTPGMLDGVVRLCGHLDRIRSRGVR